MPPTEPLLVPIPAEPAATLSVVSLYVDMNDWTQIVCTVATAPLVVTVTQTVVARDEDEDEVVVVSVSVSALGKNTCAELSTKRASSWKMNESFMMWAEEWGVEKENESNGAEEI